MEKAYTESVWNLPDDFLSHENFLISVRRLDFRSSPGIPYCREYTTNGEWLKWDGLRADPIQLQRLWYDVNDVFKGVYDIKYRVFLKMEPHKIKKCLDKRWRLIVAAPLCVQVAWHMLFDYQNDLQIQIAIRLPSQQGITLYGGDWKRYYASWIQSGLTCSLDKSAWDWTAPHWALNLDLEFRYRLSRGRLKQQWREIAQRLYDDMFVSPTLVTTDGYIFQQMYPGIMKSGCVNTISTNSHCQVFLHLLVADVLGIPDYPNPACLGDDTLNSLYHVTPECVEVYKTYGIQIKTVNEMMEFAGHVFKETGPVPAYRMKHMMKFSHQPDDLLEEYLNTMCRLYVKDRSMYNFWSDMAMSMGYKIHLSYEANSYWFDVSE
uniref:RNA-dependent RNA polymerase n=1 Tax=Solemoviridae sp. TaxID=2715208 RepID=A0A8K1J8R7_9VIRU|nr:MAG: RNA-dependent RNA polymerase [Solemoviridae sp.]